MTERGCIARRIDILEKKNGGEPNVAHRVGDQSRCVRFPGRSNPFLADATEHKIKVRLGIVLNRQRRLPVVLAVAAFAGLVSHAAKPRSPTMQATTKSRAVAFTFDDLPATRGNLATLQEVANRLLRTLVEEHVPATGFVNEVNLFVPNQTDARTALLEAWLNAGLDLVTIRTHTSPSTGCRSTLTGQI